MPKAGSGVKLDGQGQPLWLCLELTYRCPLQCPWCSNPVDFADYSDELTTEEWKRVLREGRELGALQLGFTGGEPLIRKDLEVLVDYDNGLGYYTNLITSGMGLTEERLLDLKKAGLKQIQLSIQSCDSKVTNELVGTEAHDKKLAVARVIKKHGFPMVLNVPVVRQNVAFSLASKLAAAAVLAAGALPLWGAVAADVGAGLVVVEGKHVHVVGVVGDIGDVTDASAGLADGFQG